MALIKKQIFRPSKDENIQQFLAKAEPNRQQRRAAEGKGTKKRNIKTYNPLHGGRVKRRQTIVTNPAQSRVEDKGTKKVKSEPKSPWDDESDALTQKAFEVDPEGGTRRVPSADDKKKADSARRDRLLEHGWKYVKDHEDQGSDNSNSADDRIKKARRIEARPKSTTNQFISEEEYEQDEESQSFKDWQAKNAEQEQSPVKKAVQDAWFEKARSKKQQWAGLKRQTPSMPQVDSPDPQGNPWDIRDRRKKLANPSMSSGEIQRIGAPASYTTTDGRTITQTPGPKYSKPEGHRTDWKITSEGKNVKIDKAFWFGKAHSRKDKTRTTEVTQEKLQRRAGLRAQVGKIDHDTMDKKQKATYNKNIASRMGKQNKRDPGLMYSAPQQGMSQDNRLYRAQIGAAEDVANTKKAIQGEYINMNYIQKGVWEAWLEKASNGGDLTPEQKQGLEAQKAALNRKRVEEDRRSDPPARREGTAKRGEKPTSEDLGVQDVSETGGQVTAWEGEKNPARPKGQ